MTLKSSSYATYKAPNSLYQNLINAIRVRDKRQQVNCFNSEASTKVDNMDAANQEYHNLKKQLYPPHLIQAIVDKALKNVVQNNMLKQMALTSFFSPKPKVLHTPDRPEQKGDDSDVVREVGEARDSHARCNEATSGSIGVRKVYKILKLKRGVEMSQEVKKDSLFSVMAEGFARLLEDVLKKSMMLETSTHYQQKNSTFTQLKLKIQEQTEMLKKKLEELAELTLDDMDMAELTRQERRARERNQDVLIEVKTEEVIEAMTSLKPQLKVMKRKLEVRFSDKSRANKVKEKQADIEVKNPFHTTGECVKKLLAEFDESGNDKVDGLTKEEYIQTITFFATKVSEGQEYSLPKEMAAGIGRTGEKEVREVVSSIVKWLPVASLTVNKTTVLLDAPSTFSSTIKISRIMAALKKKERTLYVPKKVVKTSTEKVKRKRGKGGTSMKPYLVEAIKTFMTSSGAGDQERRRHESGTIGFSIPQVHEWLKEEVVREGDKLPSKTAIRMLFLPANSRRQYSKKYHGILKARPAPKRNDAVPGGQPHPHRHECFSTMKAVKEWAEHYSSDISLFSVDDKAKV